MALKEYKPEKLLYTMGEVTEMFDVKPSLIRFWVDRFDVLKPKKNKKGNRLFTPADVKNLEVIYHLTKERGMTLAGVEKYLKNNKDGAERDTEIVRRLQTIRALLVEIREELKEDTDGETSVFVADVPTEEQPLPSDDFWSDEQAVEESREEETEIDTKNTNETAPAIKAEETVPDFWQEEPQVIPGEIDEEEEIAEEIEESDFDGFSEEENPYIEPDSPEEDLIDAEVSEPFTAQPLFELEETGELFPEEMAGSLEPQEEDRPSAVDTQQSLF